MKHHPRQFWRSITLAIVGLAIGYTAVLLSTQGTDVFAAGQSCTGKPCMGDDCPHHME